MIEMKGINFSYDGVKALRDINFKVAEGESVALMGPNGCGKSTLLKLLNGLIFSDSGTYKFDGDLITKKALKNATFSKKFHKRIGFVFQNTESQLFCPTVYDEIAFGPRQMGLDEKEVGQRTLDCMKLLEIEGFGERRPYQLSGGEKRKVAIAAVLALNPEVLALDEPMNELDPRTRRWLADFLISLNKSGKTLILSSHNLDLVQEMTSRAVLFGQNRTIAADMPVSQLMENVELLKKVNLVDEYYHRHEGSQHSHFHDHKF